VFYAVTASKWKCGCGQTYCSGVDCRPQWTDYYIVCYIIVYAFVLALHNHVAKLSLFFIHFRCNYRTVWANCLQIWMFDTIDILSDSTRGWSKLVKYTVTEILNGKILYARWPSCAISPFGLSAGSLNGLSRVTYGWIVLNININWILLKLGHLCNTYCLSSCLVLLHYCHSATC